MVYETIGEAVTRLRQIGVSVSLVYDGHKLYESDSNGDPVGEPLAEISIDGGDHRLAIWSDSDYVLTL